MKEKNKTKQNKRTNKQTKQTNKQTNKTNEQTRKQTQTQTQTETETTTFCGKKRIIWTVMVMRKLILKYRESQKKIDQISYRNMMGWLSCNDCFSRCLWNKSQVDVKRKIKITSYERLMLGDIRTFHWEFQKGLTTSTNKIKVTLFCCRILSSF